MTSGEQPIHVQRAIDFISLLRRGDRIVGGRYLRQPLWDSFTCFERYGYDEHPELATTVELFYRGECVATLGLTREDLGKPWVVSTVKYARLFRTVWHLPEGVIETTLDYNSQFTAEAA
jgi:hypothetical protein